MAYNNGIRRSGSAPVRECPQCGTSFYREPSKPGVYCTNACRLTAGTGVQSRVSPVERFWPKVDKSGDCWIWTAGVDGKGHGAFTLEPGKQVGAHVFAYTQTGQTIQHGASVLHTCDVRRCVRNEPEGVYVVDGIARPCFGHLFLGTKPENSTDMVAKERQARGERHPQARLTEISVRAIRTRAAEGESYASLMAAFDVAHSTIVGIVLRTSWRHVDD